MEVDFSYFDQETWATQLKSSLFQHELFLIQPWFLLGLIFGLVDFEEWCSLYSMSCLGDGFIQNYDCSSMGYLHIEHNSLMCMVATLELSLFCDVHWSIASFLVVDKGEKIHLSIE